MVNLASFDLAEFSPLPAIIGGLCLGLFSSSKVFLTGRPLGISSILRSALQAKRKDVTVLKWGVNVVFMSGFVFAALIGAIFHPHLLQPFPKSPHATPKWGGNAFFYVRILFGGLVTGVGTTYSNGCTSGHGITGISRFSLRSLVATCCFMFSAIVTGTATNISKDFPKPPKDYAISSPEESGSAYICVAVAAVALAAVSSVSLVNPDDSFALRTFRVYAIDFICAFGFSHGLIIGGMALPSKMAGFLDLRNWDPTLPFIMIGAHLIQTPVMQLIIEPTLLKNTPPLISFVDKEGKHPDCQNEGMCGWAIKGVNKKLVDRQLVFGALMFGVGWALSSTCPGPSMLLLGAYYDKWPLDHNLGLALGWFCTFVAGSYVAQLLPFPKKKVAPAPSADEEAGKITEVEQSARKEAAVAELPVQGVVVENADSSKVEEEKAGAEEEAAEGA